MSRLRICLASLALVLISGCDEPNETEVWDLRAYPSVCDNGVDYQFCGGYTVVETQEFHGLYESIGGFDPQWGHSYRVEVEIIPIEFQYDGGSVRYELVEVIDDQPKAGLEFNVAMQMASVDVEQGSGEVGHGLPFTCTPEQCAELQPLLGPNSSVRALFRFGSAEQLLPLELVSFELSEGD